jgi:outer membrane protein
MTRTIWMRTAAAYLVAALGGQAFALDARIEQPQPLTLAQVQAIALKHHPTIAAQGFRAEAAGETVQENKAALYPQIYGSAARVFAGSNTRIGAPPGAINDPTVLARGSAGISISQLITDFGRQSDLIESSEAALRAEQDQVDATRDSVLFRATEAFYGVLRAQALLKVAQSTVKSRSTLHDQVSQLRSAKLKSDLDVSFAKLGLDQANLMRLRAEGNLQDAWARLAEALGLPAASQFTLVDASTAITPLEGTRNDAVSLALARSPTLQAIEASRDASHKQADADAKAGYPVISVGGFAGTNPLREADQRLSSNYAAGGITITVPIFTGGRLTAQEKRSAFAASAADRDVDAARNTLSRDVQVAWDSAETAYRNIAVTEQLLQSSAKALDLTRARYDIGSSSIVEVEQAEVNALEGEIAQSNAKYDYLIERAFLAYREGGNAITDQGEE